MKLSQAQIDRFHEDGYLQLDDALASAFSGFIVRSRKQPESELRYPEWVSLWDKQLVHSAPWPPIPRWSGSS